MSFIIFQHENTPFQAIKKEVASLFLCNKGLDNVFFDILERKNSFLGYKHKTFKTSKNSHFCKGVNPWIWSRNGHFSKFILQAIQVRKMSFMIFQNDKTPFQAMKTRSSKSRKIDIFPKGLTHGFGPNMAFFHTFSFLSIQARKMSFMIFQN